MEVSFARTSRGVSAHGNGSSGEIQLQEYAVSGFVMLGVVFQNQKSTEEHVNDVRRNEGLPHCGMRGIIDCKRII